MACESRIYHTKRDIDRQATELSGVHYGAVNGITNLSVIL